MQHRLHAVFFACLILFSPVLAAAETDVAGVWRGSLYGSTLQAVVEQDGNAVKAQVVVSALTDRSDVLARLAGMAGPAPKPGAQGRHHPRNLRVLPNSRDFH